MELLKESDYLEYRKFVENHKNGSFYQTIEWANVKNKWDFEVIVSRDDGGAIVGGMLVLLRPLPFCGTMMYSPRGPVCDYDDINTISNLLCDVRELAKQRKSFVFKFDPFIMAKNTSFCSCMKLLGAKHKAPKDDFSSMQISSNYLLDISHKSPEELLMSFHQKWRYNIRLSQKKGVVCERGGVEDIDAFYELMKQTGVRDKFVIRPKQYFADMLEKLGEKNCRLFLCRSAEGIPLSGAIAVQFAKKAYYVYGASSNTHRELMPNHLMQWNMMNWALENGCESYDFLGIPNCENPNASEYGVYLFKKGFNGSVVKYAGDFCLVFSPVKYALTQAGISTVRFLRYRLAKVNSFLLRKRSKSGGNDPPAHPDAPVFCTKRFSALKAHLLSKI
ncbi:MAG: peptidoglycan bridge formation glycyltransferase FemA/FemB family protein [Oscillospiraceae bacterium]